MKKGTKIYSIVNGTCPRCQESKIFKHGVLKLSKMSHIHEKCDNCGQYFEPEPSFYTGAMYVQYAFSVAIVVSTFVAFNVLSEDPSVNWMFITGVIAAILFAPFNFRLSRLIWINIFIKFDSKYKTKKTSTQN